MGKVMKLWWILHHLMTLKSIMQFWDNICVNEAIFKWHLYKRFGLISFLNVESYCTKTHLKPGWPNNLELDQQAESKRGWTRLSASQNCQLGKSVLNWPDKTFWPAKQASQCVLYKTDQQSNLQSCTKALNGLGLRNKHWDQVNDLKISPPYVCI